MTAGRCERLAVATALLVALVTSAQAQEPEASESAPEAAAETPAAPAEESGEAAAEPLATIPVAESDAPPAAAPASDATELDIITVTSGKRVQAQRDIPGSVGVLRGDDLEKIKAQGLADYIKLVPGVVLIDRGADGGQPVIRGIAASVGALGTQFTQLPVGIFVDDMPFTDLYVPFSQPDLNPFDLERVEILKGPQGTLFGSGALAGAIRYILQKPKLAVWETKLSSTITSDQFSDGLSPVFGAAVNVPVYKDEAAVRVVGLSRQNTGRIDELNRGLEDVNQLDQFTGRVLGNWAVSDRLKLSGFYFLQDTEQENTPDADNPRTFERQGQNQVFRSSGISGTNIVASYGFDWGDLLSSSNYLTKDVINNAIGPTGAATPEVPVGEPVGTIGGDPDGDGGDNGPGTEDAGLDGLTGFLNSDTKALFQEFRLSSPEGGDWQPFDNIGVQWLAGLAYQQSRQGFDQSTTVTELDRALQPVNTLPFLPLPTPQGPISGSRDADLLYAELDGVAEETAIFGEATARLFEDWELTLGARAFKTELNVTGFLAGVQTAALDAGRTRYDLERHFEDDGVNPKVSLRYEFNEQVQVYALAAEGFQFGGIQLNPPFAALTATVPDAFSQYLSSTLWNYELGLRTEFFDRRLKWDTTVFYLDWTDLQITVPRPLVPMGEQVGATVGFTENIGSAKSQGVETGVSFSPIQGLSFTSSASWIKAVTTEGFDSSAGFVPENTRLPGSPRFQMANVLSYARPFNFLGAWEGGFNLTHSHLGSSFNDLQYSRPQGGYDTLDANISLLKPDWRVIPDITLSMLNLTDVRGVAAVSGGGAGSRNVGYFFVQPRTAILSVTVKF